MSSAAAIRGRTRWAIGIEATSLAHIRHESIVRDVLVSVDGKLEFGIPLMKGFVDTR